MPAPSQPEAPPQTCVEVLKTCPNNPNIPDTGTSCNVPVPVPVASCVLTETLTSAKGGEAKLSTVATVSAQLATGTGTGTLQLVPVSGMLGLLGQVLSTSTQV